MMFPLFELSRLLSFDGSSQLLRSAWKEVGEKSFLALHFSNGFLVLRYAIHSCRPIVKQLPWYPNKMIQAMCFDPTGYWLLCVTNQETHYIVPALALLNPDCTLNHTWRVDDVTKVKASKKKGIPTCAAWWLTFDGQNMAIIGTKSGAVQFVDLQLGKVTHDTHVGEHIINIDLVQDDSLSLTYALITTKNNSQWKLVLEMRACEQSWPPDEDLAELGFEEIDSRTLPIFKITSPQTSGGAVKSPDFGPIKFYQFSPSVILSPQFAKGRHFIAAHDLTSSLYMVYDTTIEHSPLYIYKVPERVENVLMTDKLLFYTSLVENLDQSRCQLHVAANQLAEAVIESVQDFNPECLVQTFALSEEEHILAMFKRTFPFYWHEKRQDDQSKTEDQSDSWSQDSDVPSPVPPIQITNHTVLDGCIIITNQCIYECRPRTSPEQLFLRLANERSESSSAEQLAIILSLDINALYYHLALHQLHLGDINQTARFFQLAKCPPQKRVAAFAKVGQIPEVLMYVQQTLNSKVQELSPADRRDLSTLALYCFIQQCIYPNETANATMETFRNFLLVNTHYNESEAVKLLSQYRLMDCLMEVAKKRGLILEALEALLHQPDQSHAIQFSTHLLQNGYMPHLESLVNGGLLRYITAKDLVAIIKTKPQITRPLLSTIVTMLPKMSADSLHQVASLFDPSNTTFYGLLAKLKVATGVYDRSVSTLSTMSSSQSLAPLMESNDSEPSSQVLIRDLISVFVESVMRLNHLRGNSGSSPQTEPSESKPAEGSPAADYVVSCQPTPISCGPEHSAFVCEGALYTCGFTKLGRLGHGECAESIEWLPRKVESLSQVSVISVSCGQAHTMALTEAGLFGWGWSQFGQVGVEGSPVYHCPVFVEGLAGTPCVQVSCGAYHTLALTRKGSVYSWGWGVHGQLGHGNIDNLSEPTLMKYAESLEVIRVAAGYAHSMFLTNKGEVYVCGCGALGQLGSGNTEKSSVPQHVSLLPGPAQFIATKYFHCMAVTNEGKLYIWGGNPHMLRSAAQGQRRRSGARQQRAPAVITHHLVPNIINTSMLEAPIGQVFCGGNFSLLLTVDGEAYSWGKNLDGQLGLGHRIEQKELQMVMRINDRRLVQAGCGGEHVIGLDDEGVYWVWGRNNRGQLGMENPQLKPESSTPSIYSGSGKQIPRYTDAVVPVKMEAAPPPSSSKPLQKSVEEWSWSFHLPALHTLTPAYPLQCVHIVTQHLGRYIDVERALQLSTELHIWQAAVWLCMHKQHYPLAFHYHLKMAALNEAPNDPQMSLRGSSSDVTVDSGVVHPAEGTDQRADSSSTEDQDCKIAEDQSENSSAAEEKSTESETVSSGPGVCDPEDVSTHGAAEEVPSTQCGHMSVLSEESVLEMAAVYIRKILDEEVEPKTQSVNIRYFLSELSGFWHDHQLSVSSLEQFLLPHLPLVAVHFYIMVNRSQATDNHQHGYGIPLALWRQLSAKFQLLLVMSVVQEIRNESEASKELRRLDPWYQDNGLTKVIHDTPKLTADKLWQDILQNLHKDIEKHNQVTLSGNEVEALCRSLQKSSLEEQGDSSELINKSVVLFTCGHNFTKENFLQTMVSRVEERSKDAHLPQTGALLASYYKRDGKLPLACPNCVLTAVTAIS